MIDRTSRYQRNDVALVKDRAGRLQQTILRRPPVDQNLRISDYLWREHERVDTVAARSYGSESSWWMFAEANPRILDWTLVDPGIQVMVPSGLA
ncbi:hypothetical protein ABZ543_12940 [Streptomyces roseifaciens]